MIKRKAITFHSSACLL